MPPGDAADGDGLLGSQAASRGEADPSAPLPLLSVGNNGFRLKKGTLCVWGEVHVNLHVVRPAGRASAGRGVGGWFGGGPAGADGTEAD